MQQREPVPTISIPIAIPRHSIDKLKHEARRRGVRADELAARILSNVVIDDLFAAVIDL